MLHGIARVLAHIVGAGEQIGTVAQRRHVEGIPGKLFLAHDVDRQVGKVFVGEGHGADVVVVRHFHIIVVALTVRPGFRPIPHLHHHILGENVLAVKEHLQGVLHLVQRPFPLMPCADDGQQHIGVMLDLVQIVVVLVIVVGAFVGVQIVLQLSLQSTVGSLRPQQISVLGGIGGCPDSPRRAVAQRCQRGHTGLHHHQQQEHRHKQQRPHGMPLDEAHGPGRQLLRGDCRFFSGLGPLLGGLPCLFGILPLDLLLLDQPGQGVAPHFRVLLGGHAVVIIRRGLDVPGLGLADSLGRVLPDFLLHKPLAVAQGGLAHQLGAVSALGAHIFLLHLENLAMHITVNAAAHRPGHPANRAGRLGRFLFRQLFLGLLQLFTPLFHAELAGGGLLLLALVPKLGLGGLRDILSRSGPGLIRLFVHGPYPPGG